MTAVVDDNVSGAGWLLAAVTRGRPDVRRVAGCGAESVDGVALEAEPDMGLHGGGDADVGVAEEFRDDGEADALLQEQCRGRVNIATYQYT
ncbi:hypothetical protein LCE31_05335 [Streptomyces sp. 8L]|nr:hypothetical protein [Streptomyces sp. 8L]